MLQDRSSHADRSICPGPRTHARTHTARHTSPPHPAHQPCGLPYTPAPALAGRPSALFSPPCWRDAALWVPEGPGGSDDPPLPHPDRAERTPHERKIKEQ